MKTFMISCDCKTLKEVFAHVYEGKKNENLQTNESSSSS